MKNDNIKLVINFLPKLTLESFQSLLREKIKSNTEKSVLNSLAEYIPVNLCTTLFEISGIDAIRKFYTLSKNDMKCLGITFTRYQLKVSGVKGFNQAEATAGGLSLDEVRYQTMESKLQKGLYFAGEILDVDGLIGGYNFQWAWSSGYVAGKSAINDK